MGQPSALLLPEGFIPVWFAVAVGGTLGTTRQAYTRACLFGGFSTVGSATNAIRVYDGHDANGQLVAAAPNTNPGGSGGATLCWPGVLIRSGVFVVTDAATDGVVYLADLP